MWIVGLLVATWAARVALRLVLGAASKVFPPMERLRDAMPAVHVVPGLRKAAEHLGVGAGAALKAGSAAAKAAGAGAARPAKAARRRSLAKDGVSVVGGAGRRRGCRRRQGGAAAGAAAAKTTVYGFLAGAKGGVRARRREPGAQRHRRMGRGARSSGRQARRVAQRAKVRAFVRAAVQAEVFVDPVAPKRARAGRRARGRSGRSGRRGADAEAQAVRRAYAALAPSPRTAGVERLRKNASSHFQPR